MTITGRRISALAIGILVAAAGPASAGPGRTVKGFYDAKQKQTSRAAFLRAEQRLAQVRTGMTELEFLQHMGMEVLARRGKPQDARMDGYLAEKSRILNQTAEPGRRLMVFGYREEGVDKAQATVELIDHQVVAIEKTATVVATAETNALEEGDPSNQAHAAAQAGDDAH